MFEKIIEGIRSIYGKGDIPLHAPVLNDEDRRGVLEAIDCGFVSSVGPHVIKFEEELCRYTGATKAVAVMNGTAALHLALIVSGVKKDDYVLTQGLTFIATANAISYIGATPAFIDSDEDTLGLSPKALSNFLKIHAVKKDGHAFYKADGQRISACVPMHVFGHPVRIEEILAICEEWGIAVIEDAAESLGSKIGDRHTGTIAPVGVLSFNGNKVITTGGGGAILFRDERLAARAKHLSTTAKVPHKWEFYHDETGFNYRMPNLNAALGCAQLKRLKQFIETKRGIAAVYTKLFKGLEGVTFISERAGTTSNYWLNAVLVKDKATRNEWLEKLNAAGLMSRPVWELMTELPMYRHCPHDSLEVARSLSDRIVNIPSGVPV
jgi:perosamine synthetase